jgi:GntR family transcriptional repressor for pyruvate dehydrogenase complex
MSSHSLKPIARNTVVETVTEQLRAQILTGSFAPGVRLPPERDLAEQLGVNRLTLRAALARLEALGLIRTHHGSGSVVRDFREHGGAELLGKLLRITRAGSHAGYLAVARDVLELRRAVAAEAVGLAAERHTAAHLVALRAAAEAQAARVTDVLAFAQGDFAFARLVVRAAGNLALELLLNTLVRLPEEDPELARAMYPRPRAQHRHYATLIGLIEAGNGPLAREAMRAALEAFDRATLARIARAEDRPARRTNRKKQEAP